MKLSPTKLWALGLLALLMACTPAATQTQDATSAPSATLPSVPVTEAPTQNLILPEATLTSAPATVVLPVATSRGPNLQATDPTTVSLASGQLQLVEFFRFT